MNRIQQSIKSLSEGSRVSDEHQCSSEDANTKIRPKGRPKKGAVVDAETVGDVSSSRMQERARKWGIDPAVSISKQAVQALRLLCKQGRYVKLKCVFWV